MLEVNSRISIPLREIDFTYARSSGPGGQNVNKVESKAVLHWQVTESPSLITSVKQRFTEKFHQRINSEGVLVLSSDKFRDRNRNINDCLDKLKAMILEIATPPKKRRPTKPSRGAVQKRIDTKKQNAQKKQRRGKIDF